MTAKEAIATAKKYNLEYEIERLIQNGHSPEDALKEWDIL